MNMQTTTGTTTPIPTQQSRSEYTQRADATDGPDISVIIPVFNEEENIHLLYEKLVNSLTIINHSWEAIFIDDGSIDRLFEALRKISAKDSRIRVVKFVRNFGQTAALAAGIDHADGKIIIPMDADLQNDPADIVRLLEKMKEGYDVVSGWRKNRQDEFFFRVFPS